jgi:hypothetical protein
MYLDEGMVGIRTPVGTGVKGERSEGAKRQPLDRMTRPAAKRARAAHCGPVNCARAITVGVTSKTRAVHLGRVPHICGFPSKAL